MPPSIENLYTNDALIVLVAAQEESSRRGALEIGAEDILVALGGMGHVSRHLSDLGPSIKNMRSQVQRITGAKSQSSFANIMRTFARTPATPWSDTSNRAIKLAADAVDGNKPIDTKHLLLGILMLDEGVSKQVLFESKVDIDQMLAKLAH